MKKTKILSVFLATIMVFTCIPYTVTASGEVFAPVDAQNEWTRDGDELGKINSYIRNTDYYFVQTEPSQQFEFTPRFFIQKTSGLRYVKLRSLSLYSGSSNDGEGRINEYPVITNNPTAEFINTYGATFNWSPAPSSDPDVGNASANAEGVLNDFVNNNGFTVAGTIADFAGCPRYYFDCKVNFKGNAGEAKGIDSGYYWSLQWTYADDAVSASKTDREVRVKVGVHVSDKRNIIAVVDSMNAQLTDPSTSEKLKNNISEALSELPENILSDSVYVEQSVIDHYYEQLLSVSEDLADYTDYNTAYRRAQYLYNDNVGGTHYTEESLTAFWNAVTEIDSTLSKKLGDNDEGNAKVAEAVQKINDAYRLLTGKNAPSADDTFYRLYGNSRYTSNIAGVHVYTKEPYDNYGNTGYGENFVSVFLENTSFKFMQLTDGENLSYNQSLIVSRNIKQQDEISRFRKMTFDTATTCAAERHRYYIPEIAQNNTQHFIDRLDSSVYTENADQLHSWSKAENFDTAAYSELCPITDTYGRNYAVNNSLVNGDGTLKEKCVIGKEGNSGSYYVYPAVSNVVFRANDDDTSSRGAYSESYVYKIEWEYRDTTIFTDYTASDVHIQTTIDVTDCRALVEEYYDAEYVYDEAVKSGLYTQASLKNLSDAIEAASDSVSGTVYKTQQTVNEEKKAIEDAVAGLQYIADYKEYNKAYEQAMKIVDGNNSPRRYTKAAFNAFVDIIANINDGLDKDLVDTPENQEIIDNATKSIYDAIDLLNTHKLCNYDYLEAVMEAAEDIIAKQTETYTSASIADLVEELNKAKSVNEADLEVDETGDNQKTVDAATVALYEKIIAVKEKADYSDFNSNTAQAQDIINNHADEYPQDIIDALTEIVDKYNDESSEDFLDKDLEKSTENQTVIDSAAADIGSVLTEAANNKYCDYSELEDAIAQAEAIETEDKTTSSAALLKQKLEEAKAVNAITPKMTVADAGNQTMIDNAAQALKDAIDGVKEKVSTPDLDERTDALLDKVNGDDSDLGTGDRYDTDVEDEVKNKIEELQKTLDDLSTDDPELEEKLGDIEDEISELEEYLENNTYYFFNFLDSDKTTVLSENVRIKTGELIASCAPVVEDYDIYVFDSWVNGSGEVVTNATEDMSVYVLMAFKPCDYSELEKAIAEAEKIDTTGKTTSSAALLEELLKDAKELDEATPKLTYSDPDNQKTIDDATQALIDAAENLKNKASTPEIDGKIEEILDKVNGDDSDLGTGDRYDTDVEDEVKNKIEELQETLDDLSEDDPELEEKLGDIEDEISELEKYLEDNTHYFYTFYGADGETPLSENVRIKTGEPIASYAPEVPDDGVRVFESWLDGNSSVVTVASADMDVHAGMVEKEITLKETAELVFDETEETVSGVEEGVTVDEIKDLFENDKDLILVYNYNDELLEGTDTVGTGSYIVLVSALNSEEVKDEWKYIIIKGDVDGNGIIDDDDYNLSMSATFGSETYPVNENNAQKVFDNFRKANDIDDDGVIDVIDTFQIKRMKTK